MTFQFLLESFSLYYASVDYAVQMIKSAGVSAQLGKADTFKVISLHTHSGILLNLYGVQSSIPV